MEYTEEEIERKRREYERDLLEQKRQTIAENRQKRWAMKKDEAIDIVDMRASLAVKEIVTMENISRHTVSSLEKKGLVMIVKFLRENRKKRDDKDIAATYTRYENLLWDYILGNNR